MKEGKKETWIFVGALLVLLGTALAIKRFTGPSAPAASPNTYIGHYGFAITLPPLTAARLQMFGAFTNAEKTSEVVFVFPREMRQEEVFSVSEARYKEYGIVRMEVNPNKSFPPGADLLAAAKFAVGTTLDEKKEPYTLSDRTEPMPGFTVDISTPMPLRQVFLKGQKVHYLLTADPGNPALAEILDGLAEISPHDAPGK